MTAAVSIGRLRFDPHSLVLYDGNEIVALPPLSAQLFAELVRAEGNVVSATWMREMLWGAAAIEDRNLNQQMYVLRRALRREPRVSIENVPRRGYRLVVTPPLANRWPRAAVAALLFAVLAAVAVLLPTAQPPASGALVKRDLALANYLASSEGPDHLDRAARYYHTVMLLAPTNGEGYGGLAVIDAKRGLGFSCGDARTQYFEMARSEANAALRRQANEANALTALGIVASAYDHRIEVAQRMFDAAVAADPVAESPRAWRAEFLLSLGKVNEAGRDFRTISQTAPTSGFAAGLLGEWLVLNRDYASASAVLSQALDLGNHPAFARYWLARSYYLRGLDEPALNLANQVLALNPGEPSALALRVRIEARRGDTRAALADFHRIERVRDPNQMDPIALASADVALGKRTEALRTLRQYVSSGLPGPEQIGRIRTDPDFDPVRHGFNAPVTI